MSSECKLLFDLIVYSLATIENSSKSNTFFGLVFFSKYRVQVYSLNLEFFRVREEIFQDNFWRYLGGKPSKQRINLEKKWSSSENKSKLAEFLTFRRKRDQDEKIIFDFRKICDIRYLLLSQEKNESKKILWEGWRERFKNNFCYTGGWSKFYLVLEVSGKEN